MRSDTFGAGSRTVSADGRYIVFRAYTQPPAGRRPGRTRAGLPARPRDRRDRARLARERRGRRARRWRSTTPRRSAPTGRVSRSSPSAPARSRRTQRRARRLYMRDLAAGTTTLVSRAEGAGRRTRRRERRRRGHRSRRQTRRVPLDGRKPRRRRERDEPRLSARHPGGHTTLVDRASGAGGAIADDAADEPIAVERRALRRVRLTRRQPRSGRSGGGPLRRLRARHAARDDHARLAPQRRRRAARERARRMRRRSARTAKVVAFTAEDETLAPEAGGWGGEEPRWLRGRWRAARTCS